MLASKNDAEWIRVRSVRELGRHGQKVVSANGRTVLVLASDGEVFAVANRCPHMGFPLSRGTVRDGILTCHWHHAKFDLAGGCAVDPFADDVTSFRVKIKAGSVWLDPTPVEADRSARLGRKLTEGLEQEIRLVLAKSVIGLCGGGEGSRVIEDATMFGIRNRSEGWSPRLTILTAMANALDDLAPDDRPLALYYGVINVPADTTDHSSNFYLDPLQTTERSAVRYRDWFRRFSDLRSANAAERVIRTAAHLGFEPAVLSEIVASACTDHLYMGGGHLLDFANKANELLDHGGWSQAAEILPSLVRNGILVSAVRMEENASWRMPVDLAQMLFAVHAEPDELIARGMSADVHSRDWYGRRELEELNLDAEPPQILDELCQLVADGVALTDLAGSVAYAAARRLIHFGVSNEFSDWKRCRTRLPTRMRSTRRCGARHRTCWRAPSSTGRCQCTWTGSSMSPSSRFQPGVPTRQHRPMSWRCSAARDTSTRPGSWWPTCSRPDGPTRLSQRWATRCCARTPDFTLSRCSRRQSDSTGYLRVGRKAGTFSSPPRVTRRRMRLRSGQWVRPTTSPCDC